MNDSLEEWKKSVSQLKTSLIEDKLIRVVYKNLIWCIEWINRILKNVGCWWK